MIKLHTFLIGLFMSGPITGFAQGNLDSTGERTSPAVSDVGSALEIALSYTGFDRVRHGSATAAAENVTIEAVDNDETPFLASTILGTRAWKVRMDQVYLDLPNWIPSFAANQVVKDYEVWIDSATGVLLKIESRCNGCDPDLAPEPPADTAAAMLRQTGEVWTGFPEAVPPVSFMQALNAASSANPVEAKEIVAWCVMRSFGGGPPIPTWQIIGRGIPPFEIHPRPKRPMYTRNRMRSVIDAVTGYEIFASNVPHVLMREDSLNDGN